MCHQLSPLMPHKQVLLIYLHFNVLFLFYNVRNGSCLIVLKPNTFVKNVICNHFKVSACFNWSTVNLRLLKQRMQPLNWDIAKAERLVTFFQLHFRSSVELSAKICCKQNSKTLSKQHKYFGDVSLQKCCQCFCAF